jgi:hypothetical protein
MNWELPQQNKIVNVVFGSLLGLLVVVGMFFFAYHWWNGVQRNERIAAYQRASVDSHLYNKPQALRDLFESDVRNGINDQYTRSAAYWILHRYFDNGGNVYEIYDYIQSHPSLSFLNEAETIHPQYFQWLKAGITPKTYATRAKYIVLAYLEVLDKHGYGNAASYGMLAHQYAFEAFYSKTFPSDFPDGFNHAEHRKLALEKSRYYTEKMRNEVADILDGKITTADMPARDLLLAVAQYGASLRYLERQGITIETPKTSKEAFAFATAFAKEKVPELYHFTSYLNASTLLLLPLTTTKEELRVALYPFYTFHLPKERRREGNIIDRIINSRTQEYDSIDMYGKANAIALAAHVPEFRDWLIANGWEKSDFNLLPYLKESSLSIEHNESSGE